MAVSRHIYANRKVADGHALPADGHPPSTHVVDGNNAFACHLHAINRQSAGLDIGHGRHIEFHFKNAKGIEREVIVSVGRDVVVGQLASIVPVVENEMIVASLDIEQEFLENNLFDFHFIDPCLPRPSTEQFAVAPGIESQTGPSSEVFGINVMLCRGHRRLLASDSEVVDGQRHSRLSCAATGYADVPRQIEIATMLHHRVEPRFCRTIFGKPKISKKRKPKWAAETESAFRFIGSHWRFYRTFRSGEKAIF